MAGKKFAGKIENPAMAFISNPTPEPAPVQEQPKKQSKPKAQDKPKTETLRATAPVGYKPNPEYVEKKTRRLQLLIQPSVYEAVKQKAMAQGKSVNDYIHTLLELDTKKEG